MSSLLNYSAKTDVVRKSSNIYPFTLLAFTKSQLCTGHRDTAAGGNPCYMLISWVALEEALSLGACLLCNRRWACCSLEDPSSPRRPLCDSPGSHLEVVTHDQQ